MVNSLIWGLNVLAALAMAPLLPGIVNKTKAFFAGRKGPRVTQLYFDMAKLLKKSSVYSNSTTWLFAMAPYAELALILLALLLLPVGIVKTPLAFAGDPLLFLYLLGTVRMLTVLAALETGSSFEGMGSSRECHFSLLAEGVLLTILGALVLLTKEFSLSGLLLGAIPGGERLVSKAAVLLLVIATYLVMLCENCRVPADDPETHLELTMIHEAMILDYGGPDLAVIHYGAALKLWCFCSLLASLLMPVLPGGAVGNLLASWAVVAIFAVSIGAVESMMARFRMLKVPQLLAAAFGLAVMAVVICAAGGVR